MTDDPGTGGPGKSRKRALHLPSSKRRIDAELRDEFRFHMEERIEQNERQIKASAEIDEEFSGDRLQKDFKQLEKLHGAASADMQLAALKQKMGLLPSTATSQNRQIGPGNKKEAETVEADIEDAHDEKTRG